MKTSIVHVSMPEQMLEAADGQAKRELRNRSEFFREAIRMYLVQSGAWGSPQRATKASK